MTLNWEDRQRPKTGRWQCFGSGS